MRSKVTSTMLLQPEKIKWIFFDLDNTLIHWDPIYEKFFLNAHFSKSQRAQFLEARRRVKELLPQQNPTARNRLLYLKNYLELRSEFSAHKTLKLVEIYEKTIYIETKRQIQRLRRHSLFQALSKRYHLAIVTNENLRTQLFKLQALDPLGSYFQFLLCSEEASVEKPNLKIFKLALRQARCRPASVLFVGDNPRFDIVPARKLGMQSLLSLEFTKSPPTDKNYISKLEKLRELLL